MLSAGAIGFLIYGSLSTYVPDETIIFRAYQDFQKLSEAVNAYHSATGSFPTSEQGFKIMIVRPNPSPPNWKQTLKVVPLDPWGNEYLYRLTVREGKETPEIVSCGADGRLGSQDDLSSLDPR